jgi:large conductance mechanosensitive channel
MRGNVVDLAVAVVIGAAFGQVVAGFRQSLLAPSLRLSPAPNLSHVGNFT